MDVEMSIPCQSGERFAGGLFLGGGETQEHQGYSSKATSPSSSLVGRWFFFLTFDPQVPRKASSVLFSI